MQNETTDVHYVVSGKEALEQFNKKHFCLVIMDTNLAETNGVGLLKTMRKIKPIPILVLTSKKGNTHRIEALRAGANGYLEKPYELEVCLAHAQSLMQLYNDLYVCTKNRCNTLSFGMDLIIDPSRRQVILKGELLNLTRKEFDLLFCFASHSGQILSKEQLYNYVWSNNASYNVDDLVKAQIKALRKKLKNLGRELIKNEWGVGYRFSPEGDWP